MRKEELKPVITFHVTAEAIATEMVYRKMEIPGCLIPVPRQISVSCGLSWSMPKGWWRGILELMGVQKLGYQTMGTYLIQEHGP